MLKGGRGALETPGDIAMDQPPAGSIGLFAAAVLALAAILACWMQRRGHLDLSKKRVRRGTGHALLGLQEFVEPSVEFIFQAENREQTDEDEDDSSGETDGEAILADLGASLGRSPVDHEEVRRHLAAILRAGLDWRAAFEAAAAHELAARPYRKPSIPPVWKVAPRE